MDPITITTAISISLFGLTGIVVISLLSIYLVILEVDNP